MIDYSTHSKLRDAGIHVDMLGQRLHVGDTVLVKGYGSSQIDTKAIVLSVNRKSISVNVTRSYTSWGKYKQRPAGFTGLWDHYPDRKVVTDTKRTTRNSIEVLKVPQSMLDSAQEELNALVDNYPECFI